MLPEPSRANTMSRLPEQSPFPVVSKFSLTKFDHGLIGEAKRPNLKMVLNQHKLLGLSFGKHKISILKHRCNFPFCAYKFLVITEKKKSNA